jgi:hypothetical protein
MAAPGGGFDLYHSSIFVPIILSATVQDICGQIESI